ncbi:MAG: hypothetical protein AB1444_10625 [Spirochaetota bacterium]
MNPQITTIQFDASTFSADDTLVKLLHASSHDKLLHQSTFTNTVFHTSLSHNFGDSSGKPMHQESTLTKRLLQLFAQTQNNLLPVAFVCTVEHHALQLPFNYNDDFPLHPFIVTLGMQFERWRTTLTTLSDSYCAHIIGMWILHRCTQNIAAKLDLGDSYQAIYPGCQLLPISYNNLIYSLFESKLQNYEITMNEYMFTPLHTVAGFLLPHSKANACADCSMTHCEFRNILTE